MANQADPWAADLDATTLVERHWPSGGPHSRESVVEAATALARLVRYLNHATGPGNGPHTLNWATTVHEVLDQLYSAVGGMDQLLEQLAAALNRQLGQPSLYDDRQPFSSGVATAHEAEQSLANARSAATQLAEALAYTGQHTVHLGNDDGEEP